MIGRRTVRRLVEAGHEVTAIARSDEKAAALSAAGAIPVRVDLFDAASVADAVAGHDAVVNVATHIPPLSSAARPSAWAENDRIRTEGSRILVDAALAAGAVRYVQESITFPYADGGEHWIDEDWPVEPVAQTASVTAAEANAARLKAAGAAGVVLRFGWFYSADSAQTQAFAAMARRHVAPTLGAPDGYTSSIHADDAAGAVVAALAVPAGTYNVGDDQPVTRRAWGDALCAALGVRPWVHPPGRLATLSGEAGNVLARSHRISNRRFREASGWAPVYPSVREGFAELA